jgi:integrase
MPTVKLTERSLAALSLPAESDGKKDLRVIYWDTELAGFGVVVGPRGKSFIVKRWVGGKQVKATIGRAGYPMEDGTPWTVMLARRRAAQLLGQMAAGHDPTAKERTRREGPTLRDGLALHVANMRKKGRSVRSIGTIEAEVPKYLAEWIDQPMVDMKGADLVDIHDRLTGEGKEYLANRVVAHVSAVFNALDRVHELDGRNPARAVTRNPYTPKRERIDDADLPGWYAKLEALAPIRRDFQLAVLFTGMRSEAARRVRWEHVDWKRKALIVPRPKGGEARAFELPLCKTVVGALKRRQKENAIEMGPYGGDAGWCFPSLSRSAPFKVQPIAEAKERRVNEQTKERELYLPGPHVLRRTYLSVAAEAGVSELDRSVLANHAFGRQSVNATYIKQAFDHLAAEQAKIERALWARIRAKRG